MGPHIAGSVVYYYNGGSGPMAAYLNNVRGLKEGERGKAIIMMESAEGPDHEYPTDHSVAEFENLGHPALRLLEPESAEWGAV